MKISVVVPTRNAERFLSEALRSIVQQEPPFEVIVVDGESKDTTVAQARKFVRNGNLTVVHAPPRGEPNAINIGFRHATGTILAWLDADDTYEPGCFDKARRFFVDHPKCGWLYGKCHVIDESGQEYRPWITRMKELFQRRYSYVGLLLGDFIAQPATFFRSSAMAMVGPLNERERLAFDYDLLLRLGRVSAPGYVDRYLASWRAHPDSETARARTRDLLDGLRLSVSYSSTRFYLRPLQLGVFAASVVGYSLSGVLEKR